MAEHDNMAKAILNSTNHEEIPQLSIFIDKVPQLPIWTAGNKTARRCKDRVGNHTKQSRGFR